MPVWGKPKKLSDEAKRFLLMTRTGFQDGDWSFVAQKTVSGEYISRPMRASWLPDYLDNLKVDDKCNIYTTSNTFSSDKSNGAGYLFSMHHLVADIDCHAKNTSAAARDRQIDNLVHVLKHGCDYGILEPSYIVYTGRGIQIWWHHEALSAKSNLWTWQSVAKRLTICLDTILADLGKDPVDGCPNLALDKAASFNPAGFYRLPGTVNQNTKTMVTVEVIHDHVFTLSELKAFRDEIPLPAATFKANKGMSYKAWAKNTLRKLYTLREMRDAPVGEELRNNFCFIVYCTLRTAGESEEQAMVSIHKFNDGFKQPLTEQELKTCLSSAVRKKYKIGTDVIIDMLGMAMEEREALPFGINVKLAAARKKGRENRAKYAERDAKVLEMYATQKYTMEEVGKAFGISLARVGVIINRLNGQFRDKQVKERADAIVALWDKGYTYEQIAAEVGCARSTVHSALRKHREAVKAAQAQDSSEVMPVASDFSDTEDKGSSFCAVKPGCSTDVFNNGCLNPRDPRERADIPQASLQLRRSWVLSESALPSPSGSQWAIRGDCWGGQSAPSTPPATVHRPTRRVSAPAAPSAGAWPAPGSAAYTMLRTWYIDRGMSVPSQLRAAG